MASKSLAVHIEVSGVRQTLRAFAKLPKEASDQLRDRSVAISRELATDVAAAAIAEGGQAALMAPTVKANRDRVPSVTAGGTKRVGRHRVPAASLLYSSEFGQNRRSGWYAAPRYDESEGRQYKPHLGRGSYWFFTTVEAHSDAITRQWKEAADEVVRAFGRDGV